MSNERRFSQIGIDRLVRLVWLEKTSSLVLARNKAQDIKTILQDDLQASFRSSRTDVRGSLDKMITLLMKTWLTVPIELQSLQVDGIEMLKHIPQRDHLVVHWGMVMAVYPFWAGVAMQVGRLLRLQGSAAASHVQHRVREQYGEREAVSRRARYVMRSFFPFRIKPIRAESLVTASSRLDILRHGLDDELGMLRKPSNCALTRQEVF